jgi:hypothetical protein
VAASHLTHRLGRKVRDVPHHAHPVLELEHELGRISDVGRPAGRPLHATPSGRWRPANTRQSLNVGGGLSEDISLCALTARAPVTLRTREPLMACTRSMPWIAGIVAQRGGGAFASAVRGVLGQRGHAHTHAHTHRCR